MTNRTAKIDSAMDALAGPAKRTGRSVNGIAKWGHNTRCSTSNAAFAARVDLDKLMVGTGLEVPFGESPFAQRRGARAEAIARKDDYKAFLDIHRQVFGFPLPAVETLNLRKGYRAGNEGLARRAEDTESAIARILAGSSDAPNLIDGAVLRAELGGYAAHLESDGIGAKFGPLINIAEIKSWPKIDGKADDAGKMGSAERQIGIYWVLLAHLVESLGFSPADFLNTDAVLITPKNVGMTLVGTKVNTRILVRAAEATIASLPDPRAFAGAVATPGGFGPAADRRANPADRIDHLDVLTDELGLKYQDSCLSSCGMAKFCREKVHAAGSPALCGTQTVRFLPGVGRLERAADLFDGSAATADEEQSGVGTLIGRAGDLYRSKAEIGPRVVAS